MRPVKILKVLAGILISVIIVISIGAALLITLYPRDRLLNTVITMAEAALKRKVAVKNINYSFGGIVLEGVVIHDDDTAESPVLVSSKSVNISFSLASLLRMEIDFNKISLKDSACNIVFDDKGVSNIEKLIQDLSKDGDTGVKAKLSSINLTNAVLTLENPPKILQPLAGTYVISGKIRIKKNIHVYDCSLRLPQQRGMIFPDVVIKTLPGNFEIKGSADLENASLLWVYQWGDNVTLPYNLINGKVTDLVITKNYVTGIAHATSTLLNSTKSVRADGRCRVDIDNRTVRIYVAAGSIEKSSFYVENLHFTFNGKLIRFNVKNIDSEITDAALLLKFMPSKLFGRVAGSLSYSAGLYDGTLSIANGGFDPKVKIISDVHTSITVNGNIFKKTDIPLKLYGNPCSLSIASNDRSLAKFYVNLSADSFTIDTFKNKFSETNEPLNLPVEIIGMINVASLKYPPFRLSNVQIQYRLAGSTFNLNGFQFLFAGGMINGTGAIRILQGPARASLSLKFSDMVIQEMIASSEKIRNRAFGVVRGNSKIEFELNSRILQTARGNVEFNIDRGKLVDTGVQNGLGLLMAEMKYKLRDLEFSRIYGNIDIAGTNYTIKQFIFNSNNVRLKVTGNFDQELVANPLYINLEFTKEFIQDLPGAITLGLNKYLRGEWYMVPFIMNGDINASGNVKRLN